MIYEMIIHLSEAREKHSGCSAAEVASIKFIWLWNSVSGQAFDSKQIREAIRPHRSDPKNSETRIFSSEWKWERILKIKFVHVALHTCREKIYIRSNLLWNVRYGDIVGQRRSPSDIFWRKTVRTRTRFNFLMQKRLWSIVTRKSFMGSCQ